MIRDIKNYALISTLYSAGLRLSECLNLQVKDIDSANMTIIVRGGKGKKDRHTVLSSKLLKVLKLYYLSTKIKPQTYLFPSKKNLNRPIATHTASNIIKRATERAKINKKVTSHTFRHSFATHLLEDGYNIRKIQVILGHKSLATTMIYTHLTKNFLKDIVSPFDNLPDDDGF